MEASAPKLPTEKNYFYRSERGSHASTCRNLTCYSKHKRNAGEDAHTWKGERFLILPITSTEKWEFLFRNVPNRDTPADTASELYPESGMDGRLLKPPWFEFNKHLWNTCCVQLCACTCTCVCIHAHERAWGGGSGREKQEERKRETEKHRRLTRERKPVAGTYPIPWELTQRTEMESTPTLRWLINPRNQESFNMLLTSPSSCPVAMWMYCV